MLSDGLQISKQKELSALIYDVANVIQIEADDEKVGCRQIFLCC